MSTLINGRQQQILRFGCPECGEPYNIIISDKEGVLFSCKNSFCKAYGDRIPFQVADKNCPKHENDIKLVEEYRESRRALRDCCTEIEDLRCHVSTLRRKASEAQEPIPRLKAIYREVKGLCLFDKMGKRVYSVANPFVFFHPITGTMHTIGNIGQKRKAKVMLQVSLYRRKEEYNHILSTLGGTRAMLSKRLQEKIGLSAKVRKAMLKLKKKKINVE